MTGQHKKLELSLYDNAIDSIKHAVEHYVSDQSESRRYKYAILHLSQGVNLLLKERLSREHPNFIYVKVTDKDTTIDVKEAIARLEKIANVNLGSFKDIILELVALRNRIEHYSVDIPKQQADSIIGRTIPFLVTFVQDEFNRSFTLQIGQDNWQALLMIQDYLTSAVRGAEARIKSDGKKAYLCPKCGGHTATETGEQTDPTDQLHVFLVVISCLVCLSTLSTTTVCRECRKELVVQPGTIVQRSNYCNECDQKVSQEFNGFRKPRYVAEIRRWFRSHSTITGAQLYQLLQNITTVGSSAPGYLHEMIDKGVIDFVHHSSRIKYSATRDISERALDLQDSFRWALLDTQP